MHNTKVELGNSLLVWMMFMKKKQTNYTATGVFKKELQAQKLYKIKLYFRQYIESMRA